MDVINCMLWLDNWIKGEERGKRHSSSGMLTRKRRCSVYSMLIQVCFRDLLLEWTPQQSSQGKYLSHLFYTQDGTEIFSIDKSKVILVTCVHTVNSRDLEKFIFWKKGSSHLQMVRVSRIQHCTEFYLSHTVGTYVAS